MSIALRAMSARPRDDAEADLSLESASAAPTYATRLRFNLSFFGLGLLNNAPYVVILSAALDLVAADVPKGVVLMANIAPALLVKAGWPYLVHGKVQYARRIIACSIVTLTGILMCVPVRDHAT